MTTLDRIVSMLKQKPELVDPLAALLEHACEHDLSASDDSEAPYRQAEQEFLTRVRTFSCALQCQMLSTYDGPAPELLVFQGQRYRRAWRSTKTYTSLDGPLRVSRWLYRSLKEDSTICPLELRAGLVEGKLTPAAARLELMSTAGDDYRKSEALCAAAHLLGARGKSSLERDVVRMGPKMREQMPALERARRAHLDASEALGGVATISVSVDRTGLPFEEPVKRGPGRPKKGSPKKPCQVVKRQTYCACLTMHDDQGRALSTQRFAGLPRDGDEVVERARACLEGLTRTYPEARLIGLCDGAVEMQRRVREIAAGRPLEAELVDAWHAAGYVSRAFGALGYDESWRQEMVRRLLENKTGLKEVLIRLRTGRFERDETLKELEDAITFLENNGDRMKYAQARAQGLPIGSGCVEATCKCVVAVRFKRSGARWKPRGAEPLVHVRSWLTSGQRIAQPVLDAFLDSYVTPLAA